mmetsp:Transcript_11003/g.31074  ORF Transcript_11003/g.31074 Transcript_11003/m.31074 type:complete len:405 (+) Transcript_11003:118-1332(+)|eukprot:CAMPEP_0117668750 /NCGR_PEP_ID=MMETSP0804-20121206/11732_1 /TAXON_ID=1074897 /ORGANISM="Tetraselmis astigmatica, Strain CCMP880" /LENGTH=404 /DNA_ID=CAMNT_0005476695 /DNA_START=193 /DNA_END=1407 /DNA_ORIENTATION=-
MENTRGMPRLCRRSSWRFVVVAASFVLLGSAALCAAAGGNKTGVSLVAEKLEAADEVPDQKEMEDLLHWAVTHSDSAELRRLAAAAAGSGSEKMTVEQLKELAARRAKIKEAIDAFKEEPTEVELMKEAIQSITTYVEGGPEQFSTEESEVEFIESTLKGLQILVEPIDNANDMKALRGIQPLVQLLSGPPALQRGAAGVIGTAASNNPTFQGYLMEAEPSVISILLRLVAAEDQADSVRGLYALGAMVRNTHEPQTAFFEAGGVKAISERAKLAAAGGQWKVSSKCLQVIADLAVQGPQLRKQLLKEGHSLQALETTVAAAGSAMDIIENALFALEALAEDRDSKAMLVAAGADSMLSKLESRLGSWPTQDEDEKEYLEEVVELLHKVRGDLSQAAGGDKDEL